MNFICVKGGHLKAQVSVDHRDYLKVAMDGLLKSLKRNEGTPDVDVKIIHAYILVLGLISMHI